MESPNGAAAAVSAITAKAKLAGLWRVDQHSTGMVKAARPFPVGSHSIGRRRHVVERIVHAKPFPRSERPDTPLLPVGAAVPLGGLAGAEARAGRIAEKKTSEGAPRSGPGPSPVRRMGQRLLVGLWRAGNQRAHPDRLRS